MSIVSLVIAPHIGNKANHIIAKNQPVKIIQTEMVTKVLVAKK